MLFRSPLYLRWSIGFPFVKPYVGIGPSFSFAVQKKIEGNFLDKDDFGDFDFGVGGMVGVEILKRINVSANYHFGLTNQYKGDLDINVKNKNFSINLGISLYRM